MLPSLRYMEARYSQLWGPGGTSPREWSVPPPRNGPPLVPENYYD